MPTPVKRLEYFKFDIVLKGISDIVDDPAADAFYDAGCDDATLAIINGVLRLSFTREADCLESAVSSAVRDILKVVRQYPFVRIVSVDVPGLRFIQSLDAMLGLPDTQTSQELLESFLNAYGNEEGSCRTASVL